MAKPTLSDSYEDGVVEGRRLAYRSIMIDCLAKLGYESTEARLAALVDELERARLELRELCDEFDCNDWPDNLDLADAIGILGRAIQDNV